MRTLSLVLAWAALLAWSACIAAWALRSPKLRANVERIEASRLPALDGLRGILALSVFVHHAYLTRHAALFGSWGAPDNAFVQLLGLGSVAIFFMITAFLFWSRALAQGGHVAPLRLYRSRLRRIFPAFAGSIALLLLVAGFETQFRLREPAWTVAAEIASQFSLGLANGSTVNGLAHAFLIDAGVTWSLGFESVFYAALPLLAISIRGGRSWIAPLVIALVAIAFERHWWIVVCFIPGIAAAEIAARPRIAAAVARRSSAILAGGCLLLVASVIVHPRALLTLEHGPQWDVLPQLCALCAIFVAIVLGPGPALLKRIEFRFLGAISYSVYLLHAIVLYVVTHLVAHVVPIAALATPAYWFLVVACTPLVIASAACSYFFLESPFVGPPIALPAVTLSRA